MSDMGMDKSGTQSISSNSWTTLTGWVVRSGFPGTVINGDQSLEMDVTDTGTVNFLGTFTNTSQFITQEFRIRQNGTVVGSTSDTGTPSSEPVSVTAGDLIELQAFSNSSQTANRTVDDGAANTYVEFIRDSVDYDIEAVETVWDWDTTADLAVERHIEAELTWNWDIEADLHVQADLDIEAELTWNWGIEADLLHVPKPTPLPSIFAVEEVAVSVHTADGRAAGDIPCWAVTSFTWGRESVEVTTASVDIATQAVPDLVEEIYPWVHWITIWHDAEPVWTGPIRKIRIGRSSTSITARDTGTLMWRTRTPITRTWSSTSPEVIADELWQLMFRHHGIRVAPVVLPTVSDSTFTVAASANQRMMHQLMDDLTKVGLEWTVVAGRPVLGKFPQSPVAELQQCDFLTELERRRDGSGTYNDVRVQGQNWAETAIVDLAGLGLQSLVSLDDMFGAGNIQRATEQYARDSAQIRDELLVPGSASLHPSAPVTLDDLIPGKIFLVAADEIQQLMRLDAMTVSGAPSGIDVQVTLVALEEPVAELTRRQGS